uniref:Uncharacterized protein n=1 Tax=Pristionchus pacificus TaxID=54126 RepID=A0A2A6BKT4_PRIPA|eukprot:PDM66520.1 hypothetical protein PRIPAC_47937 [Pristionchus pacificus]
MTQIGASRDCPGPGKDAIYVFPSPVKNASMQESQVITDRLSVLAASARTDPRRMREMREHREKSQLLLSKFTESHFSVLRFRADHTFSILHCRIHSGVSRAFEMPADFTLGVRTLMMRVIFMANTRNCKWPCRIKRNRRKNNNNKTGHKTTLRASPLKRHNNTGRNNKRGGQTWPVIQPFPAAAAASPSVAAAAAVDVAAAAGCAPKLTTYATAPAGTIILAAAAAHAASPTAAVSAAACSCCSQYITAGSETAALHARICNENCEIFERTLSFDSSAAPCFSLLPVPS